MKHSDHSLGLANWANMEESKQTQGLHSNIKMQLHVTNISENNLQCSKNLLLVNREKSYVFFSGSYGKVEEISEKPFTVNYSEFKLSVDSELFPKHLKQ